MPGARILVVDDDGATRELLRLSLELEGYTVDVACNGVEGWKRLHASRPSVVLLDIMMPEMDGAELLGHIRSDPDLAATPVVVVSAFGSAGAVAATLAQDYLPKPFDLDVLVSTVARHCAAAGSEAS